MTFWKSANSKSENSRRIPVWLLGVAIGVICLAVGYGRGDLADIYKKAVMICLECIGIG